MKKVIIFTIGASGSGKTHFCDLVEKQYPFVVRLEKDSLRRELLGNTDNLSEEGYIENEYSERLIKYLKDNSRIIILSDPILDEKMISFRKNIIKNILEENDYHLIYVLLEDSDSFDTLVRRIDIDLMNPSKMNIRARMTDWGVWHQSVKYSLLSNLFKSADFKDRNNIKDKQIYRFSGNEMRLYTARLLSNLIFDDEILPNSRYGDKHSA